MASNCSISPSSSICRLVWLLFLYSLLARLYQSQENTTCKHGENSAFFNFGPSLSIWRGYHGKWTQRVCRCIQSGFTALLLLCDATWFFVSVKCLGQLRFVCLQPMLVKLWETPGMVTCHQKPHTWNPFRRQSVNPNRREENSWLHNELCTFPRARVVW